MDTSLNRLLIGARKYGRNHGHTPTDATGVTEENFIRCRAIACGGLSPADVSIT